MMEQSEMDAIVLVNALECEMFFSHTSPISDPVDDITPNAFNSVLPVEEFPKQKEAGTYNSECVT